MALAKVVFFISMGSTAAAEVAMGGRGFFRRLLDREPVVATAIAVGAVGLSIPTFIVPLRRSMGYNTDQFDGAPALAAGAAGSGGAQAGGSVMFSKEGVGARPTSE